MINLSTLSRTGLFGFLLISPILAGEAMAQSRGFSAPGQLPEASADTSKGVAMVPPPATTGKLQIPQRSGRAMKAPAGDEVARSMTATMRSRDGKETTIQVPADLRNRLMSGQKGGELKLQGQSGKLTQINKTTDYPYTTMGVLANGCPGVLVLKRFVLTAGYCVYNPQDGKWYDNLDFFPAYNGKDAPYGAVKWKNVWAPEGFTKDKSPDYNFGLVELAEDIGDKTGWMGFSHFPEFSFKQLNVTSYPYEGVPQYTMWQTTCKISSVQDNYFFYQCPGKYQTVTAMGGGPVWFKGKADSDWWVTGIHIGNVDDKKSHWAVRLNEANVAVLLAWAQPQDTPTDDQTTDDQTVTDDKKVTECTCDGKTDETEKTEDGGDNDRIIKPILPGSNTQQ